MPYEVTDFWTWTWLRAWAPTFWYGMAFVAFWFGSGVFVFRSLLRTWHSCGRERSSFDEKYTPILWTFSSMRVLIVAAILGPALSPVFALVYLFIARRAEARRRRHLEQRG